MKDKVLQVRMSEQDYQRLCNDAISEGISVSDYVRVAVDYKHYNEVPVHTRVSWLRKVWNWFTSTLPEKEQK